MAANPLSCLEIEAFCRLTLTELSAWEAELLMRLDDTALATWRADREATAETGSGAAGEPGHIKMSNGAGITAMLRRMKARKSAEFAAKD